MKVFNKQIIVLTVIIVFLLGLAAPAFAVDTLAKQALMIDVETKTVLMEKKSQEAMPTSSMSKTMTMYMVFEALKEGRIKLDDTFMISERAWRMGGSKMFIKVGDLVKVEDLIQGVVVQSGNDAAVALAEGIAGSEDAFAEMMNVKAKELGMEHSHFVNASGWPDPNHYSTAYDLAMLGYHLVHDFPDYYHYFAETEYTYNNIKQRNRNPLLYMNIGADGIKTGHTEIAGYGLMASAFRDGRRLMLVVNGLTSDKERSEEASRLLAWGFMNFDTVTLFKANDAAGEAKVWLGMDKTVPLVVAQDVKALIERTKKDSLAVSVRYKEPISAPIAVGTEIGTLAVKMGEFPEKTYPLYAGKDVAELGFVGKIMAKAKYMIGLGIE